MKLLLDIVVGLIASLGMFGAGVAIATAILTERPGPQPGLSPSVAALWTDQPRRVDQAAQDFERLPARQVPITTPIRAVAELGAATEPVVASLDATVTASTQSSADEFPGRLGDASVAVHFRWCAERYRSYRQEDDSYAPYSGRRRPCVSPYLNDATPAPTFSFSLDTGYAKADNEPMLQNVSYDVANIGASRHVRNCFNRYRSYQPEDNTYQPFDGGPRRQCR